MNTQPLATRLVAATILMAGAVPAGDRVDAQVRDDFFAGFEGNHARLERAVKQTEAMLAADPKHAEALVWHGSALFYQSGQAFRSGDPAAGIELSRRGLDEMDRAAALEPENLAVRIPRGAVLLTATRSMPVSDAGAALLRKGLADYEHAWERQKDSLDSLTPHARGELLFGLAEGYLRCGDPVRARQWFERLAASPGAVHADQARTWLATGRLEGSAACAGCHVR